MERIQNILQRLQELYGTKHRKSAIDIDLMLDYTRVMYADLLEWKRNLPQSGDDHAGEEETGGARNEKQPDVVDYNIPGNDEKNAKQQHKEPGINENRNIAVAENSEPQVEELIREEERGISFEPPHQVNPTEIVEEVLVEEEPVVNEHVENIEIPQPAEQEHAVSPAPVIANTKDIRSGIGINDKYLFLNELFNNHKTEYEEALDILNRFQNYEEAHNWLVANIAVNNKWVEDDETVQSFFSLLKKHFSASR